MGSDLMERLLAFADAQDSGGCCDLQFETGSDVAREAAARITELEAALSAATARAEAAEAEAARLREDSARLDWLDTVNIKVNERNGTVYGWKYDINHNRAALTDHNLPALTVREAIDSARFPDKAREIALSSTREGARLKAFRDREQARRAALGGDHG